MPTAEYPGWRQRSSETTTSYFFFESTGNIGKLKANDTAYIYNGKYAGAESDDELWGNTEPLSETDWASCVEDNCGLPARVGATPIIRAH